MVIVERRMGDRGWLGRSTVAGGVVMGATRGRKCLVGSDVDGERVCVPSDLTSESNESCDDWDGDITASSGPRISVHRFILLTLRRMRKK